MPSVVVVRSSARTPCTGGGTAERSRDHGQSAQGASPRQGPPLHESDQGVGAEPEDAVEHQADDDDLRLPVGARELHHVADPGGAVDLLDHDERQPRTRHGEPQPQQEPGQRTRQHDPADERPARQADRLGQLDVPGVDGPQPVVGVDVHRDEHAQQDGDDLHRLADAEPEDEQRQQREARDGPLDLHGSVDERLAHAGSGRTPARAACPARCRGRARGTPAGRRPRGSPAADPRSSSSPVVVTTVHGAESVRGSMKPGGAADRPDHQEGEQAERGAARDRAARVRAGASSVGAPGRTAVRPRRDEGAGCGERRHQPSAARYCSTASATTGANRWSHRSAASSTSLPVSFASRSMVSWCRAIGSVQSAGMSGMPACSTR